MTAALKEFVERSAASDIAIHSLQISVRGDTIVSDAIPPFGVDVPHRTYSVSKSITALAILLLAHEGELRLDDPIVDHFPEMAPAHPWLVQTRIDDMLAMTGPHSRTTYDEGRDDWLASYFHVPPTHRAGTQFTYDTSASYVLAALVERLSGASLLDYLRPRLLEPLGGGADARFLRGPDGYSHGGSGLVIAPVDLLAIGETLNGRGMRHGARILPESVVDALLERRSDPGMQTWGAPLRAGYGRQIWLPDRTTWLMFGLGGQLVYGDPERQVAAVITADTTMLDAGDQRFVDAFLRALADEDLGAVPVATPVPELTPPTPAHHPGNARALRGAYQMVTGENAPQRILIDIDADGGTVQIDGRERLSFSTHEPTVTTLTLGDAVVTSGVDSGGCPRGSRERGR